MTTHEKERRKVIVLMTSIIVLLLIVLFSSIFYIRSSRPMRQARQEATQIAQEYANIEDVESFYWFTRQETFFSVIGTDDQEQEKIVIIPQSGEQIIVLEQSDGLSEAQVRQVFSEANPNQTIRRMALGMVDNQPVWEIMTQGPDGMSYFLFDFKDGTQISAIQNI